MVAFRATNGASAFASWRVAESQEIVGGGLIDHRLESSHGYRGRYGFGYVASPLIVAASVPDWFLLGVLMAVAAAPWAGAHVRFSLSTLLVAMALVSAGLGVAAYFNRGPASPPVDVGDFGPFNSEGVR
jgi:hypothetical protein